MEQLPFTFFLIILFYIFSYAIIHCVPNKLLWLLLQQACHYPRKEFRVHEKMQLYLKCNLQNCYVTQTNFSHLPLNSVP